jgi:hypothetical protein
MNPSPARSEPEQERMRGAAGGGVQPSKGSTRVGPRRGSWNNIRKQVRHA